MLFARKQNFPPTFTHRLDGILATFQPPHVYFHFHFMLLAIRLHIEIKNGLCYSFYLHRAPHLLELELSDYIYSLHPHLKQQATALTRDRIVRLPTIGHLCWLNLTHQLQPSLRLHYNIPDVHSV